MEKQTAVGWLLEELLNRDWYHLPESIKNEIIQQAKAMEQEQIIEAYQSDRFPCSEQDAEQYYNETFNS
jgi:hypothetical protein